MVRFTTISLLVSSAALAIAHGCADHKPEPPHPLLQQKLERRQRAANGTSSSSAAAAVPTGSPASYNAGDVNTYVPGAPPLPDWTQINLQDYPALDRIPPLNSAKVRQWVSEVEAKGAIPSVPLTGLNGCSNSTFNAQALRDAGANGNCWWTCGGCTRDTDVTVCPRGKNIFGVSFDDGPSDDSPRLLNYLDEQNIKSTFFIVGSRALSRPEILQREYMNGHEISVHTWSHNSLTTLSNEEIIAELGWTKEIIKAVIGVTPTTMRPPYGDVDDRVRAISLAMGLTPVIWTSVGEQTFDTEDWRLGDPSLGETEASIMANFNRFLNLSLGLPSGFIVLAHDLYPQSVDLALNRILPGALAFQPDLTLMPIISCQDKPLSAAYVETTSNSNTTSPSAISSASQSQTSTVAPSSGPASSSATGSATAPNQSQSSRPSSGASSIKIGAGVVAGLFGAIALF